MTTRNPRYHLPYFRCNKTNNTDNIDTNKVFNSQDASARASISTLLCASVTRQTKRHTKRLQLGANSTTYFISPFSQSIDRTLIPISSLHLCVCVIHVILYYGLTACGESPKLPAPLEVFSMPYSSACQLLCDLIIPTVQFLVLVVRVTFPYKRQPHILCMLLPKTGTLVVFDC